MALPTAPPRLARLTPFQAEKNNQTKSKSNEPSTGEPAS
jgi:hypothetical protein